MNRNFRISQHLNFCFPRKIDDDVFRYFWQNRKQSVCIFRECYCKKYNNIFLQNTRFREQVFETCLLWKRLEMIKEPVHQRCFLFVNILGERKSKYWIIHTQLDITKISNSPCKRNGFLKKRLYTNWEYIFYF